MTDEQKPKSRRGFASMSEDKRREIAGRGGKAAQAAGRGHRFTEQEAREAGRKGGLARRRGRRIDKDRLSDD